MVESFRINAVLNLKSNAPIELAELGRKFQAFDNVLKESTRQVKAFETALSGLGTARKLGGLVTSLERLGKVHVGNLSGLAGLGHLSHLGSINTAGINKIASSMSKLGASNLGGLSAHLQALIAPLTTIHNLHTGIATAAHSTASAWQTAASSIHASANAMRGMRTPPPRPPGGGGGGGGGGASLDRFGKHWLDGSQAVQDAGAGAGMVSGMIETTVGRFYHGGMEAGEALSKLALAGFNAEEVQEANRKAFEVQQRVPGATVGGNLEIMKDVYSVMQDAKGAIASTSEMASMGVILEKMGKGDQIKELFATIRAGELAGAINKPGSETIDQDLLTRFMHALTTVVVKTLGRVSPSDYVAFFQQAGIAGARMSEEARFTSMPAVMMAMKSVRAGTALQSWQQSEFGHLAGGYGEQQAKIGLFRPEDLEKIGKGPSRHIRTGALLHGDELQENPVHWIWGTLMPLLSKAVDPKGKMDDEHRTNAMLLKLYDLFPRNTITRIVEDVIRNKPLIEKDEQAIRAQMATNPDYNKQLGQTDPKVHEQAATAAWDAFSKAMGQATTGEAVGILDKLTGALNKLSDWAHNNPVDAAKYTEIAVGLGLIMAAITAMGVAMMVITPAATALTTALGGAEIVALLAAHYFPGKHAPGEKSMADTLLDSMHMKPAGAPRIDWHTGNVDFGLGGYSSPGAPSSAANSNSPGSSSSNPLFVWGLNTPSGREISQGTSNFQAAQIAGPRRGLSGPDSNMTPQYLTGVTGR